jgi:CheY-like chemotaxis protein
MHLHPFQMLNQPSIRIPCIFVLEADDDVRPVLRHNLQHWGYRIIMTIDREDVLQRIQHRQEPFGLILLDQFGQSIDELRSIGQRIRQSITLDSRIPILIMAERYGADLEGQDIQVGDNEYISYLEDGQQLRNILQRLCPVYGR